MIDDHDSCEWVNVSSGTTSPRLYGCSCSSSLGCHKTKYTSLLMKVW